MASPGQKWGTCGHFMAAFDGHKKCMCYRNRGLGDNPCVFKTEFSEFDNASVSCATTGRWFEL